MPRLILLLISTCIASCTICFLSCKKEDEFDPVTAGHVPIPGEMLDYFAFDYGSFIVYKDSATGATDSSYITYYYAASTICGTAYCTSYDYLGVTWRSDSFGDYTIYCNSEPGVNDGPNMMRATASNKTVQIASNMQIHLPYTYNYNNNYDSITLADTIPVYYSGNFQFMDAMRIEHTNDPVIGHACIIYLARNVGLIRLEIPDLGQVWEVENYNINPL